MTDTPDPQELLERYAQSDPDHVVLNFTHGAYSPRAFEALRKVLELHVPRDTYYDADPQQCEHCADQCHSYSGLHCESPDAPWPCPTVRVITEALAGDSDD